MSYFQASMYIINTDNLNWELIFTLDSWNDIFTRENIVFLRVLKYDSVSVAKNSVSHWCLWNKW